jgi:hypothetical protein
VLVEAAIDYLDRGYAPVPVPPGQKGPAWKDWQHLELDHRHVAQAFRGAGNIGLILGRASRDLVDVDLDCVEARDLADEVLPNTIGVTGRPSSPRSHRWYLCPGVQSRRHQDPVTHASIIEIRGTGLQTLVGPSIHPSGEPYDRLAGEPAKVSVEVLMAAVAKIATEVVRRRHGESKPIEPIPDSSARPPRKSPTDREHLLKRASAYLGKLPPAISGCGGHNATYWAAIVLVHGFELTEAEALTLLEREFNPRCDPEWTQRELLHKVKDAATKPHHRRRGWLGSVGSAD